MVEACVGQYRDGACPSAGTYRQAGFRGAKLTCGWLADSRSRPLGPDLLSASQPHDSLGATKAGLHSCRPTSTSGGELALTQPRRMHARDAQQSLSSSNVLRNTHEVLEFEGLGLDDVELLWLH